MTTETKHMFTTPTGCAGEGGKPFTVTVQEEDGYPVTVRVQFDETHFVVFTTEAFFQMVDKVRDCMGKASNSES